MKLQKTTLGLLIAATLLGIGVASYELLGKPKQEELKTEDRKIFNFQEDQIQTLTIKSPENTLEFTQTSDTQASWKMLKPQAVPANDAVVSFLINLLVNGETEKRFPVTDSQLKDYGLDSPLQTIIIKLKNNTEYQLILGKSDFENKLIYAKLKDKPEVLLVSKGFEYALERDLKEWQQVQPETPKGTDP